MSTIQVNILIERMKTDFSFRNSILNSNSIEERLNQCKQEGIVVSKDDFKTLSSSFQDNSSVERDNLANTWLCKGPCHTKCAAISVN